MARLSGVLHSFTGVSVRHMHIANNSAAGQLGENLDQTIEAYTSAGFLLLIMFIAAVGYFVVY